MSSMPFILVLGIGQDGGCPQIGCVRDCCRCVESRTFATSLAIVDGPDGSTPSSCGEISLVECTADIREQYSSLRAQLNCWTPGNILSKILLTHAHVGHILGLPFFGDEMMGLSCGDGVQVLSSPDTIEYLQTNDPFRRVLRDNFGGGCRVLSTKKKIQVSTNVTVESFFVPHRVETLGFIFEGPNRRVAFIPDIDYWGPTRREIEEESSDTPTIPTILDIRKIIRGVDVAYIDGTFFDGAELPDRDMSKVPHPTIRSSVEGETFQISEERDGDDDDVLDFFGVVDREKIRFIHLNHTNPVLREDSLERKFVEDRGFRVARQFEKVEL